MAGSAGSLDFEKVREGDLLAERRIRMDRGTYFAYNKLVTEINPLHFDADYSRRLGFRDIVVAGVYTFSFIPKMVEDWAGEAGRISGIEIKYIAPVYIDETIVQKGRVTGKTVEGAKRLECEVVVEDSAGATLTEAVVTVEF